MTHDDPPISPYETILEGQPVFVNKNSKVVIINLKEVFRHAGTVLKWDPKYHSEAFGINKSILRLVELGNYKLLINYHSNESKIEYWIDSYTLRKFIEENNAVFKVKGKQIFNIPLILFKPKPTRGTEN